MAIQVGESLPMDIKIKEMGEAGPKDVTVADLTRGKKVVLFSVPGAFTPTCSMKHLPGFVENVDALKQKGVDDVICMSVNDAFVMGAWGKAQQATGKVRMIADGNGELAKALGLTFDGNAFGMGLRSQRFALIVEDGKVTEALIEPGGGLTVSSAESVLSKL